MLQGTGEQEEAEAGSGLTRALSSSSALDPTPTILLSAGC